MTTQPRLAILQFSSRLDQGVDPLGPTRGLPRLLASTLQTVSEIHCEVRDLQHSVEEGKTEAVYLEDMLSREEAIQLAQVGDSDWCLYGLISDLDGALKLDFSLLAVDGSQLVLQETLEGTSAELGKLAGELATRVCSTVAPEIKLPGLALLREGLSENPQAMMLYLVGLAQSQLTQRAEKLKEAVEADPSFVDAGLELAQSHLLRREFELAEAQIIAHTSPEAISREKLLSVALRFFSRGFVQESIYLARKAMMWGPDKHESYLPYIKIALLTGNVGDGVKYTQRAAALAPDEAIYQAYLALFYRFLQQPENSLSHGRRGVQLGPNEAFHHYALGSAHLFSGAIEESLPHFQRALELNPSDVATHREMALAHCEISTVEDARAHIEQSLQVLPTDSFLLTVKARTWATEDPAVAEQALELAIQHQPSFPDAHGLLGSLLRERGEYDRAEEHLEQAIALDGQNPEWYRELGRMYLATSNPQQAQTAFARAQELEE